MESESMSNNNDAGGSGEGSCGGLQAMPSTAKKVVQNLKEIVNVPEQEIYAVLKDCDMEPNVAVERLLSQDTFHVVKSKRDRRKEMNTQEFGSHVNSTGRNRGGRAVTLRQRGPSLMSYNDLHKVSNKGESGSVYPSFSSSKTPVIGRHTDSDSFNINGTQQSVVKNDSSSTSVPSSLHHVSALSEESKANLSLAEIVRMGKPRKNSQMFTETFHPFEHPACSYQAKSTQISSSQPEQNQTLDFQNKPDQSLLDDGECGIEQQMASNLPLSDVPAASGEADRHSNFPGCTSTSFTNHDVDAVQLWREDLFGRDIRCNNKSASSAFPMKNSAEGASIYQTKSKDYSTYDSYIYAQHCQEAAASLQRLGITQTEEKVGLVLPNHLQALVADCPHLSFGTYNAGSNSASPMPILSNTVKNDWKESSAISFDFLDSSNSADNGSSCGNYRASMGNDNHGYLASSLQEQMKQGFPNATPGLPYINSLSNSDPNFSVADLTSLYRRADLKNRDFVAFSAEKSPLHPQHLGVQPVDRLANTIGHPSFLTSDGSGYNLRLQDMMYNIQQNRNEVSLSRMPFFDKDTYRNLRSLAHNPGNFVHDSPKVPVNSSGCHNIIPSQYRGGNNLSPLLKQNVGFSMYGLGHESAVRSLSSVSDDTYRQCVGRNQHGGEYQLAQLSSSYGVSRYSDLYPSHTGIPIELSRKGGSQDYSEQSLHTWHY